MKDKIFILSSYKHLLKVSMKVLYVPYSIFKRLIVNRKMTILSLFLFIILFGISTNLIMGTSNDPGDDGAYYYDAAENIKEGRGFVSDIKMYWLDNWNETEEKGKVENPYFGVVFYPLYEACVLSIDESIMAIRMANSIISGITIVLLFLIISKLFNDKIAFLSSLFFIFNPFFFMFYTSINSEAFYMMVYLVPFYIVLKFEDKNNGNKLLILAGVMSAIVFLSRMVGLLVIISIILWYLYRKKFKNVTIYGLSTFFALIPWLVWNYSIFSYLFPYSHIHTSHNWPAAGIAGSSTSIYSSGILLQIKYFRLLGLHLVSINLFYFLMPFVIIGSIRLFKNKKHTLFIIFSLLTIVFHLKVNYNLRYMLPIVPLMIPFGLKTMMDTFKNFKKVNIFSVIITGKRIFALFVLFILLISLLSIADNIKDRREMSWNNRNYEKYQWLKENASGDAIICSTEPRHAHYFTNRQTIILAFNLDQTWMDRFIDFYSISYIVLEESSYTHYEDNDYLKTLYKGNETYSLSSYKLVLVHEALGYGNDILFYKIEKVLD